MIKPKRTSIYILSSSIDPNDHNKAKSFDIVKGFVPKPLTPTTIVELIEDIKRKEKVVF